MKKEGYTSRKDLRVICVELYFELTELSKLKGR